MRSVRKVLLDLQSDHTLGYKTQRDFEAIIESLTALNNNQPLDQLFYPSPNMSSSSNNQYVLARGLTITCPTVTHTLRNHRGNGPYTTPEEVRGSPIVVSQWLTFALDYQNCGGDCHRGGFKWLPNQYGLGWPVLWHVRCSPALSGVEEGNPYFG